jgi:spoIIIJ-associated protein
LDNENPADLEKENDSQNSIAEQARQICLKLISFFPLFDNPRVHSREEKSEVILEIEGDKSGILIGKHGQTLLALEFVLSRIIQHQTNSPKHIYLDCEGYRKRRRSMLEHLAKETAAEVAETRMPVGLGPMSSDERKIIHMTLKDHPQVFSESEDLPPNRQVVIKPRQP